MTLSAAAQERQAPAFRTSVDLVTVNALVSENGRPLVGLRREDFDVWDNGIRQRPNLEPTTTGISVVLVLDTSGSVTGEMLNRLTVASRAMISTLTSRDRITLITFSERVHRPTTGAIESDTLLTQLEHSKASGRTSLYDAIFVGLSFTVAATLERSALVVFTDGVDNSSWLTRKQLLESLKRSNSVMYVVGRGDARTQLEHLALATGGQFLPTDADRGLATNFVRIVDEFRSGYLLSYTPEGVALGDGWHSLQVQVRGRQVDVKARPGYYSR